MPDAIRAESLTKYYGPVVALEALGPGGRARRSLRLPRTERRRQDHDHQDPARPGAGDQRTAFVDGLDCRAASLPRARRVGYLPAEMPLYREMTGGGYLDSWGRCSADRSTRWLRRLLARFDVSDVDLRRRLDDLSHGMKRKFGIIQALMGHPPRAHPRRADVRSRSADD